MPYKEKILDIAARELGVNKDELFPAMKLADVFDSLDFVSFIMAVKEELGPISNEDATKCETFADVANIYELPSREVAGRSA